MTIVNNFLNCFSREFAKNIHTILKTQQNTHFTVKMIAKKSNWNFVYFYDALYRKATELLQSHILRKL